MRLLRRFAPLAFLALVPAVATCQTALTPAKSEALRKEVTAKVDANAKLVQVMVDTLFSFGELGFQETETSKYLTDLLEKNGFTIERGIAGMPTAWMATWGSGSPVIALGSDLDCIPQASQKPGVAYHDPIIPGAPGHGEGHNSGNALNIVAALAVKDIMVANHLPGTIKIWPGVAEELLGGKAYLVRDGYFKGVDDVLFSHVGDNFRIGYGGFHTSGLVSVQYNFHGESAHSAMAPWRGRSALDAVELMDTGWNFKREHLRLQQRSHYVISNGGDQPNVVPQNASVWYYFRETDYQHIKDLWQIGDDMAKGATLMTNTTVDSQILGAAWPGYFSKPIAEDAYENARLVGLPTWSADDQTLAKALQHELKAKEVGLATKLDELGKAGDPETYMGGGSDDIGDVSWVVPTMVLYYPCQHSEFAWPQLGQCDCDGDADRSQGYAGWREGAGADAIRPDDKTDSAERGRCVLCRADEGAEVHSVPAADGQALDVPECRDHEQVPDGDEEVLLRLVEVSDISGAVGDQVSDGADDGDGFGCDSCRGCSGRSVTG